VAPPSLPSGFGEYLRRISHVIALQGIFGILLLYTLSLPDRSPVVLANGEEALTLLEINSLAIFALFLVLTMAVFRQESDGALGQGDPFLQVLEGYGSPSGSVTLFRAVHAVFSVIMILVYLTAPPGASSLHGVAGILVLFLVVIFSSSAVPGILHRTLSGRQAVLPCIIYLLGLGLIFGGALSGTQDLLVTGMVVISLEILYVIIREDRRVRSGDTAPDR
jgi:hypothetical protein